MHDKQTDFEPVAQSARGCRIPVRWRLLAGVAATLLALTAFTRGAAAREDAEIPFDVAELFFELNDTDGDLGIHAMIDGGPWKKVEIEDPRGRRMLAIWTLGRLRKQALTELFFESAEPSFEDLDPVVFFARFPEGTYEIEGRSETNQQLESETQVTHALPAPAEPTVNGNAKAEVCDEEDPDFDIIGVSAPVTIAWPAVTVSHPDLGTQPPVAVEIVNYEVVVEVLDAEFPSSFGVILEPGQTAMTLPDEFLALGESFKYEVLAREASFNQTGIESCFTLK